MSDRNNNRYQRKLVAVVALLLAGAFSGGAWATSFSETLDPTAATCIDNVYPNLNFGGVSNLAVGQDYPGEVYRSLLRYDLSSIPRSAIVTSASLQITLKVFGGQTVTLSVYEMTTPWVQGSDAETYPTPPTPPSGATWNTSNGTTPWTIPGAGLDHVGTASASVTGLLSPPNTYTFTDTLPGSLASNVQGWIDGSTVNDGWILMSSAETAYAVSPADDHKWIDVFAASNGMVLSIDYTVVPEPGIITLLGIGLACIAVRRRISRSVRA